MWNIARRLFPGDNREEMNAAFTIGITVALAVVFGCQTRAQGEDMSADEAVKTAPAASDANGPVGPAAGASATQANRGVEDSNGPTILLNYGKGVLEKNPMCSFLYFIPLISTVPVGRHVSAGNQQHAGITSYERKVTSKSFSVASEFAMSGKGVCRYTFDPVGMIALRVAESKKPKGDSLSNVLDYINFEGEGLGVIRIKGTIADSVETVTEVELEFNARGRKSPVTIGLYELKSKNGRYGYENRSGEIVARVNSLVFKRSERPRMDITVASISKKAGSNGPLGRLKAAIANLFIKPVKIDPLGNEALLDFGCALFEQKPTFTFPKAANIKEVAVLPAEPNGE